MAVRSFREKRSNETEKQREKRTDKKRQMDLVPACTSSLNEHVWTIKNQ
jgi:hypothetical protein